MIKSNQNIQPINIFDNDFLYTGCTDDTTFFIKNRDNYQILSIDSWETAGIGVLKGIEVALCRLKYLNLENKTMEILGCHFSYNKKIQQEKNFTINITSLKM